MQYLSGALEKNGYKRKDINRVISRQKNPKPSKESEKFLSTSYLPYIKGCTDKLPRVLRKENVKVIFTAQYKIMSLFPKSKEKPKKLERPGIYQIPYECGKSYIGQTGRNISTRIAEHTTDTRRRNLKSAVAEHFQREQRDIRSNGKISECLPGKEVIGQGYTEKHWKLPNIKISPEMRASIWQEDGKPFSRIMNFTEDDHHTPMDRINDYKRNHK